jgi:hypothetical protein
LRKSVFRCFMDDMSGKHNNGKGIHLTDDQKKNLIIQIQQNGDAIDDLWDSVIELKSLAIAAGKQVKNAQAWQASARNRANTSSGRRTMRKKFFDSLGLD